MIYREPAIVKAGDERGLAQGSQNLAGAVSFDLGHKARRRVFPADIAGLIGPGERKSVQSMADRDGEFG